MKDGIVISGEKHGFRFRVPHRSPDGQAVQIQLGERDGMRRVHAMTADKHEVYFEVRSYPEKIDHEKTINSHKAFIAKQFEQAVIGENESTDFRGFAGTTFSFESKNFGRRFLFVDANQRTYCIVYDHEHPHNETMLDGFEILALVG